MIQKLQCAWCKDYFGARSVSTEKTETSHGICKSCIVKYFPEQVLALVKNKTIKNSKID